MKNVSSNGTVFNPHSWNSETNIFFLDEPCVHSFSGKLSLTSLYLTSSNDHGISSVGVGFSYADYGETVGTTEEAALNVYAFISIFFETFSQFKGRPLHLSGESYGVSLRLSSASR